MDSWQRIEATLRGEATDHAPVALWRHFPEDDQDPGKLVEHTLQWQRRWQFDLVKFMPSGTYGVEDWGAVSAYRGSANGAREVVQPAVRHTDDWRRIRPIDARAGVYGRQNDALEATARALGGTVPILQTVFSPLTTARKLATERLFADLRRAPDLVEEALRAITDVTIAFALDAVARGAHGMFFASQLATYRLLSQAEYERFGLRYDLEVFEALRGKARLNMLHLHGDDIMFDLVARYPAQMINWHDRLTEPSLAQALARLARTSAGASVRAPISAPIGAPIGASIATLVGGVSEQRTLVQGTPEQVRAEVRDALEQTGGRRLVIGPGCVVPVAVSDEMLQAVVDTVRRPS